MTEHILLLLDINSSYLFGAFYFDSTRNESLVELKDRPKDGSFFGPFYAERKKMQYYISLQKKVEFDAETYEYEIESGDNGKGHIFALYSYERGTDEVDVNNDKATSRHYRLRKNLGSKLDNIKFNQLVDGIIELDYTEGDICRENERHKSKVFLICDKNLNMLADVDYFSLGGSRTFFYFFLPSQKLYGITNKASL